MLRLIATLHSDDRETAQRQLSRFAYELRDAGLPISKAWVEETKREGAPTNRPVGRYGRSGLVGKLVARLLI